MEDALATLQERMGVSKATAHTTLYVKRGVLERPQRGELTVPG